jgi:hypothetical protein
VVAPAVGLDHQPLRAPQEVDEKRADADVHLRLRQVVAGAQAQEQVLELAVRLIRLHPTQLVAEDLRLSHGLAELGGSDSRSSGHAGVRAGVVTLMPSRTTMSIRVSV